MERDRRDTPKKDKTTRLLSVDGLRGIAACLIAFGWHYQHFYTSDDITPWPLGSIFGVTFLNGWILADLFFIISGLSASLAYTDRIMNGSLKYGQYLKKRIKRLYPLHFITLLAVALLQVIYRSVTGQYFVYAVNDLKHFILNLFLLNGGMFDHLMSFNGPAWYMGILFILLVLFYPVIKLCRSDRMIRIFFSAVTFAGVMFMFACNYVKQEHLLRGVVCFSIGVLINGFRSSLDKRKKMAGIVSITTATVSYVFTRVFGIYAADNYPYSSTALFILYFSGILFWSFLIIALLYFEPASKLLSKKVPVYLGKISLLIYMIHFPLQLLMKLIIKSAGLKVKYDSLLFLALYILVVLGTAALSKAAKDHLAGRNTPR